MTLPGNINFTGIGDYCSDKNVLAKPALAEVQALQSELIIEKFREPLNVGALIELPESVKFTASSSVRLDTLVELLWGNLSMKC